MSFPGIFHRRTQVDDSCECPVARVLNGFVVVVVFVIVFVVAVAAVVVSQVCLSCPALPGPLSGPALRCRVVVFLFSFCVFVFVFDCFRDRYKGDWKDGMMHGKGTFMWSKGDMYEGDWRAGKMHGHGVKKMGNGDVYEGSMLSPFWWHFMVAYHGGTLWWHMMVVHYGGILC